MLAVVLWYVALQAVGLAALPVALRVLGRLPDRGYAFARPLGLLFAAYVLWLGAMLGLLDNRPATALLVVVGLGVAGWGWLRREAETLEELWRQRRALVLTVEGLFLVAFLGWALVRAYLPEIVGTEKPMELAFLSGILRSDRFPPLDPWLSGFSISYYYFGYVVAAFLVRLTGVAAGVAFNLTIATLFALTATGAFALGYNLVAGVRERLAAREAGAVGREPARRSLPAIASGLLAATFVLVLANWEGVLEILHSHGFNPPGFWQWVGIKDLSRPYLSPAWHPTEPTDNWWWFRASRVIADYPASGPARDYTINEFPFFSFLLGDMHPHVLALPFVFLALAFALNLLRSPDDGWAWLSWPPPAPPRLAWLRRSRVFGAVAAYLGFYPAAALRAQRGTFLAAGLIFGGLSVLNAWDLPTYLFVLVGAFAIRRYLARPRLDGAWRRETLTFGWLVFLAGLVLYLPFYPGFRSQAAGFGLVGYRTQLHHFAIFWGPLLAVVGSFLAAQLWRTALPGPAGLRVEPAPGDWTRAGRVWPFVGVVVVALLALLVAQPPAIPLTLPVPGVGASAGAAAPAWNTVIVLQAPALAVILPLLVASLALLWRFLVAPARPAPSESDLEDAELRATPKAPRSGAPGRAEVAGGAVAASLAPEHVFALLLAFTALLLLLGTEFVFLRDVFGNRMNTVFKLYYQVWALLALVAAYGAHDLLSRWPRAGAPAAARLGAAAWLVVVAAAVGGGLVYAPAALLSRTGASAGPNTLDGTAYLGRSSPGDYAAIQWLQRNVAGSPVIVEASGNSYSQYARVATQTGLPTLLGWYSHETQWRGNDVEQRRRAADIDTIYKSTDQRAVQTLLQRYGASYVYVGPLEVEKYGRSDRPGLEKFASFLDVAYQAEGVTIYRVRGQSGAR